MDKEATIKTYMADMVGLISELYNVSKTDAELAIAQSSFEKCLIEEYEFAMHDSAEKWAEIIWDKYNN